MMEKFTEWQWPISGVHSIMMEKSALAGEGEGCTPNHLHYFTITYKVAVAVYAPAAGRADTLTLFHLYTYALCGPGGASSNESETNACSSLYLFFTGIL
jgi:hypothetical protein